jgi:hypothetical protein
MPSFKQHCNDCLEILGDRSEKVNHWMDAMHSELGFMHRRARHHWGGVAQAEKLFGVLGRKAALIHILKDCGRIPKARDYEGSTERIIRLKIDEAPNPHIGLDGHWDQEKFLQEARKLLAKEESLADVKNRSESRVAGLIRFLTPIALGRRR